MDEDLLNAYATALTKSRDLLLGKVAPYDLSSEIVLMETISRYNPRQFRNEYSHRILEEDESGYSRLGMAQKDTLHIQLADLEDEEPHDHLENTLSVTETVNKCGDSVKSSVMVTPELTPLNMLPTDSKQKDQNQRRIIYSETPVGDKLPYLIRTEQ